MAKKKINRVLWEHIQQEHVSKSPIFTYIASVLEEERQIDPDCLDKEIALYVIHTRLIVEMSRAYYQDVVVQNNT